MTTRRVVVVGVLLFAALVGAIYGSGLLESGDDDRARIREERAKRARTHDPAANMPKAPDDRTLAARLATSGFKPGARVFIRIFKLEFELEVWLERQGRFHLFQTYPICRWSGELGPKIREGDRQAPEGFYTVDATQLNPASRWHRSFNLGFPNLYDRARGRTGTFLMVHGGCSSAGCYAMGDAGVDEIWRITTAALVAGQPRFHVHIFPFRLTENALARRRSHKAFTFWQGLMPGFRAFEETRIVPRVSHCRGSYAIEPSVAAKHLGAEPLLERCPAGDAVEPLPVPSATGPQGARRS